MLSEYPPVLITAPAVEPVALADVKEAIRVYHSDDDTMIAGLISQAVSYMDGPRGVLGRCMIEQTWRQDYRDFYGRQLRLPVPDVSSITSVTYYDANGSQQTLSASSYHLVNDYVGSAVELDPGSSWPTPDDRPAAVSVTFVAGFGAAADDVPDLLKRALMGLVGVWYQTPEGDGTMQRHGTPYGFHALIAPWRRVGV